MKLFVAILCSFVIVYASAQWYVSHQRTAAGLLRFSDEVRIGEEVFSVARADTPEERERGLSGQPTLTPGKGMLFVFDTTTIPSFWMKDMAFPLDIVWIDSEGVIVDLTESLTPETYPRTVSPRAPVRFVLEIPSGTIASRGISIGQLVTFKK